MLTVMIADDSTFQRQTLCRYLQKEGFKLIEAKDGDKCLQLIRAQDVDAVVLDLNMPDVTGKDVLSIMHKEDIKIPVIVVTADIQHTTREKCLELGAWSVLNKPPDPNELIQKIYQATGIK